MQQPMVQDLVVEVDGTKYSFDVDSDTSLEAVKQRLSEQTGLKIISFLKASGVTVCPPAPAFSFARALALDAL